MNSFTITLTHPQANLIFNALQAYVQTQHSTVNELIQHIDGEFLRANPQLSLSKPTEEEAKVEQSLNG